MTSQRSLVDGHRRPREAMEHAPRVADDDRCPDPAPAGDLAQLGGLVDEVLRRLIEDPALELADLGVDGHLELARLARETDRLDRRAGGGQRGQQPGQRLARQVGTEVDHVRRDRRIEPEELAGPGRPRDGDRLTVDRQARGHVREAGERLVELPARHRSDTRAGLDPEVGADLEGRLVSLRGGPRPRVRDGEDAHRHGQHQQQRRPRVAQRTSGELASTRATERGRGRRLRRARPAGQGAARSGARRSPRPAGRAPASRSAADRARACPGPIG